MEGKYISAHVYRLYTQHGTPARPYQLCVQELSDQRDGSTCHRHEDFEMTREELTDLLKAINEQLVSQ